MNNVTLMGRLTKDVDYTKGRKDKKSFGKFTIAVRRDEESADFIPCVVFGATADFVKEYFKKGSMIAITGKLSQSNYEDENGNKHNYINVIVNSVYFTGEKK